MAKQNKIQASPMLLLHGVLIIIIVVLLIVIILNVTQPKEKFGFSFPNPKQDNKIRNHLKGYCNKIGGKWRRGGDFFSAWIWGTNAGCVEYKLGSGSNRPTSTAGYCCYDRNMSEYDENAEE